MVSIGVLMKSHCKQFPVRGFVNFNERTFSSYCTLPTLWPTKIYACDYIDGEWKTRRLFVDANAQGFSVVT